MKCNKCGLDNLDNVTVCSGCGTNLTKQKKEEMKMENVPTKKSTNLTKGVTIAIVGVAIVGIIVAIGMLLGNKETNDKVDNNDSNINESNEDNNNNNKDYTNYTADFPKSERTIDYYWNINTSGFNKNKFDGNLSVFGTIINNKITGKTLKDAGFVIASVFSTENNIEEISKLDFDENLNCYSKKVVLVKDGKIYPTNGDTFHLVNYSSSDNVYDDSTEVYYTTGTDAQFLTYKDSINPYFDGIEFSNLTIDDVIEKLGVPTYVENRKTKFEDVKFNSIVRMDYVYVYDNYLLEFTFSYGKNINVKFNNVTYMGKGGYLQPYDYYDAQAKDYINYESYIKYLEVQQNQYLEAIKK